MTISIGDCRKRNTVPVRQLSVADTFMHGDELYIVSMYDPTGCSALCLTRPRLKKSFNSNDQVELVDIFIQIRDPSAG